MDGIYDRQAPKRPVDDRREQGLDAAIAAWNEFDARHGAFADKYLDDFGLSAPLPPP